MEQVAPVIEFDTPDLDKTCVISHRLHRDLQVDGSRLGREHSIGGLPTLSQTPSSQEFPYRPPTRACVIPALETGAYIPAASKGPGAGKGPNTG